MNFWENVNAELEFKGINRKTLAQQAGFDVSSIGKGMKNGNVPAADTALQIADALGVTIEYLLDRESTETRRRNDSEIENEFRLLRKYRPLIHTMETLSEKEQNAVKKLAENLKGE